MGNVSGYSQSRMRRIASRLLSGLLVLSLFPLNGWGSTTRQVRDTLIMGNVKYAINRAPINQMDSALFLSLKEKVGFDQYFSWNFRGYVATWRVFDDKLYLDRILVDRQKADFREVLQDFKDSSGNVLASWFSGTIICGTGPVLCKSPVGWDDLNETEVELTIRAGVVTASRTYRNKVHKGSVDTYQTLSALPENFDFSAFPELSGKRVITKIAPCRFDKDGKILDWTVAYPKWPEDMDEDVKNRLTAALINEMLRYDWGTFCADGRWFWQRRKHDDGIVWPLIFKASHFKTSNQPN